MGNTKSKDEATSSCSQEEAVPTTQASEHSNHHSNKTSIYTKNNLTLSDLTAMDGGFLLFLLERLVHFNLENDIPVLQYLDEYIEYALSEGREDFLIQYQVYRMVFVETTAESYINQLPFVGIMNIQLVNIFQKEINKLSRNYNIWHILIPAKYKNVNKRFLLMLAFSVAKHRNLSCDTENAWNEIAYSLQKNIIAKIQKEDVWSVKDFISTTNMCLVNCKSQEIAMATLFSFFNIVTPTWKNNPDFFSEIIKQMLHNYNFNYYEILQLLNMETFISEDEHDEHEHFNIFPILLVFYLTNGEDNAGQTLPSAHSQTDRETLIRLFSKLYSLPKGVIVSKNDQSSVDDLISTIVDFKEKIQTRCWTEKTNIQNRYQIKVNIFINTRQMHRPLHIDPYMSDLPYTSNWNWMADNLYRCMLYFQYKQNQGVEGSVTFDDDDVGGHTLSFLVLFFIFLSCLFTYLMLGLAGAELKKYLSLKYSYKEAALLLLWISNDVHRNPGPKSDLEQAFSVKLRKVTLNMCKKLLTLYQGRELSKSPNNLYTVETDFNLCNVLDGKEILYTCVYKDLDTEVLIDILLQCFKEKRISWKKSGYEMELLQKEIDAWKSCEFDQLFHTHFTSTYILEKTADIASKLERMAIYMKRVHLNEVLKEIGISFQPLTLGSSENDASLCWLASRSIASIFYKVVKAGTSQWPLSNEKLEDPNNEKRNQKQKKYFKQLFKFCEKEYPEHSVLKENKSFVEACKNWIDDSKQKEGLIEHYVSRHDKEAVKKILQSLGEDDLILEAIPILAERGITLSTTNYCTQKNSLEKGPIKRKSEASHSATHTQRTDVSCKKTQKEKELNIKTEIKIKLWVNAQLKDVTVKTHGKTIDFKKLCQKSGKEVKIYSEGQPQIDYPATNKTQVYPQQRSRKSLKYPRSLEDTTSALDDDLPYQGLRKLSHFTQTTSNDFTCSDIPTESTEESLNQMGVFNEDSSNSDPMVLPFGNSNTWQELAPTTEIPELDSCLSMSLTALNNDTSMLIQENPEILQQSSGNTNQAYRESVSHVPVDTLNDNVQVNTSSNITEMWEKDKDASDDIHKVKTDIQSPGIASQDSEDSRHIMHLWGISWDKVDLTPILSMLENVDCEHTITGGNDLCNSQTEQFAVSQNCMSLQDMDFLD